jgi:hypothetical protein
MKLTPFLFGSIDRKEESAALPSREGAAALLRVLASWLEGRLRNYTRWETFRASPPQGIAIGLRTSLFDSLSLVHAAVRFRIDILRFCFSRRFSMCRALAKRSAGKVCIFPTLQMHPKEALLQRGTLCLRGTKRTGQSW